MANITLVIPEDLKAELKEHEEVNWSAVIRNAVAEKLESMHEIDLNRSKNAAKIIDGLRKSGAFDKGKSSTEIIREWREKRR